MPQRVAIIHDWLTGMRGGEKVLEVLCELFPAADLFTLLHVPGTVSPMIERHPIHTSFLQHLPQSQRYYRHLLPLMPIAMEGFDFSPYDLLISTSHCVAKMAKPRPGAHHVCYCHTPMRYIWDQYDSYFGPGRASWPVRVTMRLLRPALQRWDLTTLPRVHRFIANSKNVSERIQRIYHRESVVIYPPTDVDFFSQGTSHRRSDDFYLLVSALAPYKRVELAIEALQHLGRRLIIIGDGQQRKALRQMAGDQVEFLGWGSSDDLRKHYAQARALLFPGEEDFGIVPVEAMAAGCPVIALRKGGALETVVENQTGIFFNEPTVKSLADAIQRFETMSFSSQTIRDRARLFDRQRCAAAFQAYFVEYK